MSTPPNSTERRGCQSPPPPELELDNDVQAGWRNRELTPSTLAYARELCIPMSMRERQLGLGSQTMAEAVKYAAPVPPALAAFLDKHAKKDVTTPPALTGGNTSCNSSEGLVK
jgi:hypothetical protein